MGVVSTAISVGYYTACCFGELIRGSVRDVEVVGVLELSCPQAAKTSSPLTPLIKVGILKVSRMALNFSTWSSDGAV